MSRIDRRNATRAKKQRKMVFTKVAISTVVAASSVGLTGFAAYDVVNGENKGQDLSPEQVDNSLKALNAPVTAQNESESLVPPIGATVTEEVQVADEEQAAAPASVAATPAPEPAAVPSVTESAKPEAPVSNQPVQAPQPAQANADSPSQYKFNDIRRMGVIRWGGYKFTYYSQRVLPGRGLRIPGRHVNADGFVADADGYIVLANSAPRGTVINTPFGAPGKVYDRGTVGNHFDVYTM